MLNLLVWIAGIAILGCVAAWLAAYPGSLTFFWLGWRVDTSVSVLLAAIAAVAAITILLTLALNTLVLLPRRMRRRRKDRSYALGLRAATGSLVALATGDLAAARKFSAQTQRHLPGAPLSLLISAQTARLAGNDAELHRNLEAMLTHKETRFLAARGLSDRFTRQGDDETALAYAEQAWTLHPRDPAAAEALAGLYARLARWQEAKRVLRGRAVKGADRKRLMGMISLAQAERLEEEGGDARARRLAQAAQRLLKDSAPASALVAKMQAATGKHSAAIRTLKRAWKHAPSQLLAETLMPMLDDLPLKTQLKIARRFAALQPDHPESQLLIARAGLQARDWQTVREALGLALARKESAEACRLMALLEREGYGDILAAERWDRRAEMAAQGRWQCEACGHTEPVWHAHCPQCRAFGKAEWVTARAAPSPGVMSIAG